MLSHLLQLEGVSFLLLHGLALDILIGLLLGYFLTGLDLLDFFKRELLFKYREVADRAIEEARMVILTPNCHLSIALSNQVSVLYGYPNNAINDD